MHRRLVLFALLWPVVLLGCTADGATDARYTRAVGDIIPLEDGVTLTLADAGPYPSNYWRRRGGTNQHIDGRMFLSFEVHNTSETSVTAGGPAGVRVRSGQERTGGGPMSVSMENNSGGYGGRSEVTLAPGATMHILFEVSIPDAARPLTAELALYGVEAVTFLVE